MWFCIYIEVIFSFEIGFQCFHPKYETVYDGASVSYFDLRIWLLVWRLPDWLQGIMWLPVSSKPGLCSRIWFWCFQTVSDRLFFPASECDVVVFGVSTDDISLGVFSSDVFSVFHINCGVCVYFTVTPMQCKTNSTGSCLEGSDLMQCTATEGVCLPWYQ